MAQAAKQYPFSWSGKDQTGSVFKGNLLAVNEAAVRANLRRQGLVPVRIRRQSTLFRKPAKITTEDIAIFSRQLATMLQAGIPLVQAFDIVATGHENPGMQKLLSAIKVDLESGTTLAEALAKHPVYFDDLFVNLVRSGEQSGALETLLDKIAVYKEKTEAIKKKIKKALTYPAAVLVVAFIVTAILLVFVIPQFEDLFKGFGAELPAFTKMVVGLSGFVRDNGVFIVIALVAISMTFTYFRKRSRAFNHFLDRVLLRLPVLGEILRKASIARFTRTLSTMFAAGVPLVEALESVAGATGNIVYELGTLEIRTEVATGIW
jgi:type IV pilus assembly protein PilC